VGIRGGTLLVVVFFVTILLASSIPIQYQATAQSGQGVGQERVLVYIQTSNDKQRETISSRSDVTVRFTFDDNWISAEVPQHVKEILENRPGVLVEDVSIFTIDAKKDCGLNENKGLPQCKPKGGNEEPPPEPPPEPEPDPTRVDQPDYQITWGLKEIYNYENLTFDMVLDANGGAGVNVAVLDTGVFKDHPDLINKVLLCKDFMSGKRPKNTCVDGHGHGTHVSGSVLADGGSDKLGILGVAPGANLFAFKVCTDGGACFGDSVSAAIKEAERSGANIISMSFVGSLFSTVEKNAIDDALDKRNDLLFIAASGNFGPGSNTIGYPAAYHKVVAVAAVDSSLNIASFSSRGVDDSWENGKDRLIDVSGPGVAVESTWNDGGYATKSGTSMATPHISGLAANVWSLSNGDASTVRSWLQTHTDDSPSDYNRASGFGFPHQ